MLAKLSSDLEEIDCTKRVIDPAKLETCEGTGKAPKGTEVTEQ